MWYKKAYYEDIEGASDSLDIIDEFRAFYDKELGKFPKGAVGLAMLSPDPLGASSRQYFYSASVAHSHFFHKIGAERCPKPEEELFCIEGDCAFAQKNLGSKIPGQ